MLKAIHMASLVLILVISSCKKQIIRDKPQVKNQVNSQCNLHDYQDIENNAGENKDVFSPVSERQAKQFANNRNKNSTINSPDVNQRLDQSSHNFSQDFSEFVRQKEAKLSDIPIPLNSEPLREYFYTLLAQENNRIVQAAQTAQTVLGYTNAMNMSNIIMFYTQEMERLGWQSVASFDGFEKLLIFKKPFRFCSISIRSVPKTGLHSSKNTRKKLKKRGSFASSGQTQEHCKIVIYTQT
ncbi:hypothetical protein ACFLYU_00365 [Candidatus Dependentiae bacterium]